MGAFVKASFRVAGRVAGKTLLALLLLGILAVLLLAGVLFFKPDMIVNSKNLERVLENTTLLKTWSWDKAQIDHEWIAWNERILKADFENFCFLYEKDGLYADSCLEEVSWNVKLKYEVGEGFKMESLSPVVIDTDRLTLQLPDSADKRTRQAQESNEPPDIKKYWDVFWGDLVPDAYINFDTIELKRPGSKDIAFDVNIQKEGKKLAAKSMGLGLDATPEGFQLDLPKNYELPFAVPMMGPVIMEGLALKGDVGEDAIRVRLGGAALGIDFQLETKVEFPLKNSPGSTAFLKDVALSTSAHANIENIKARYAEAMDPPYNKLPAPLNALEGNIGLNARVGPGKKTEEVEVKVMALTDMKGGKQALDFDLLSKVVLNLETMTPGPMYFDLELNRVVIQLPRLPKNSLPPQFAPDGRIQANEPQFDMELAQRHVEKDPPDINMRVSADTEESLGIRTNLLDEMLRLNVDMIVEHGKLKGGYVRALPLETTFFKRDITIKKFVASFDNPKEPEIDAEIEFDLPEYKVTFYLEGPFSNPRHYVESDPPLPEEDIYAVLLFGRPMIDLEGGERNAAQRTNQVLSQGLLSISVLYFLSDTPIQAIIYDPDSERLSAQFALDDKRSVTVGRDSVGVRQSLGGGWYIDTSSRAEEGYGVMLERIIAY